MQVNLYTYKHPIPIEIALAATDSIRGKTGLQLREEAKRYMDANPNVRGAERGSSEQQGYGALAEVVLRHCLGMQLTNPSDHPIEYDFMLSHNVRADSKCRGGRMPFKEYYDNPDGIPREAKHNFFARQVLEEGLETDVYVMSHLLTPQVGTLPGTARQRKWSLFVCGWISKERVRREGTFLPRGAISERGNEWFAYRGQEIEVYHKNLNGISSIDELNDLTIEDVEADAQRIGDLNLTNVDAIRIATDLVGLGILSSGKLQQLKNELNISGTIKPFLHPNQYHALLKFMRGKNMIDDSVIDLLKTKFPYVEYSGI